MLLRLPKYSEKLSPVLVDPERNSASQTQAPQRTRKAQTAVSAAVSDTNDSGLTQSGVQIFPLEVKKPAAPLPAPEPAASAETASAPVSQEATAPATSDKASEAVRPETPTQLAPATYSVTSGNKLAEELKKANNQK